ncbi:hypothetical protein O0544_01365 [Edwardsiella anguillarum]|nr:hypothetical protein [Edwardsiella anguillarum]
MRSPPTAFTGRGLYRIGASAGLTLLWHRNALADEAINQADAACYMAKRSGRGQAFCHQGDRLPSAPHGVHEPDAAQLSELLAAQRITLLLRAVCPRSAPSRLCFICWIPSAPPGRLTVQRLRAGERLPTLPASAGCRTLAVQPATDPPRSRLKPTAAGAGRFALHRQPVSANVCQLAVRHAAQLPAARPSAAAAPEESALIDRQAQTAPALSALHHCGCRLIAEGFERRLENIARLEHSPVEYLLASSELVAQAHANRMDEVMLSLLHTRPAAAACKPSPAPPSCPLRWPP